MGHRINEWVSRLLIPACVVATMVMGHWGFGVWRTLAILLPIFGLPVLVMIVVDPGPRVKGFVEGLRSRFR